MKPTIGRTVLYMLTAYDAERINALRKDNREKALWLSAIRPGLQQHSGNEVREGAVFPMVIVAVWGPSETSAVNGHVLLDGSDSYWATSVSVGTGPGKFSWPVIEREEPKPEVPAMAPVASPPAELEAAATEG